MKNKIPIFRNSSFSQGLWQLQSAKTQYSCNSLRFLLILYNTSTLKQIIWNCEFHWVPSVCHNHDILRFLHCMMFQTIQTIYFLNAYHLVITMTKAKTYKKTNKKTKTVFLRPKICYTFEKQGAQGYQIWHFPQNFHNNSLPNIFHQNQFSTCLLIVWTFEFQDYFTPWLYILVEYLFEFWLNILLHPVLVECWSKSSSP